MSGSSKNQGCTVKGMCGKENTTANLQDLLIFNLKGIAVVAEASKAAGIKVPASVPAFVGQALFTTITNANFNDENLVEWINRAQAVKKELPMPPGINWAAISMTVLHGIPMMCLLSS